MAEKTDDKTEETTVLGAADQEVLDYVTKEEAEADKLFAEINGGEPESGEKEEDKEDPKEKPDEKKEEPKEPAGDGKKEADGKLQKEIDDKKKEDDGDLAKDLTVENADKRISAAQTKMHDSNNRANTADKDVARLKEENEKLQGLVDKKEAKAPKGDATKEPEGETTPDEDELQASLADLSAEYPEIAKPLIKIMAKQEVENKALRERLDKTEAKETERVKEEKEDGENAHYKVISDVHEDFAEISKEPLFDEWINGLPVMEKLGAQAIRKNGAPEDVIELLTKFKEANGYKVPGDIPAEDSQKVKADSKLEKAKKQSTPTFNKAKDVNVQDRQMKFTRQQIHDMSEAEFAKQEPEIDKALAEGLVG